jgi:hypothetical protein
MYEVELVLWKAIYSILLYWKRVTWGAEKSKGKWGIFYNTEVEVLIEDKNGSGGCTFKPEISRLVMRFEDEDVSED